METWDSLALLARVGARESRCGTCRRAEPRQRDLPGGA